MHSAFLAFQEGHRDYRINALRFAALTEAAYAWPVLSNKDKSNKSIPIRHPVYGIKLDGTPNYFILSAEEAYAKNLVPIYSFQNGFIAVPMTEDLRSLLLSTYVKLPQKFQKK